MRRAFRLRSKRPSGRSGRSSCSSATSTTVSTGKGTAPMMHTADMLKVFAPYREDAIVIPGRGGRYWAGLTTRPNLDLPVGDPAMGGHAGFALGIALAQPGRKVILF